MLTQEQAVEIKVLARRGVPIREIARQLGCSRNTVRRYLANADAVRYGPRSARPPPWGSQPFPVRSKCSLPDESKVCAVSFQA